MCWHNYILSTQVMSNINTHKFSHPKLLTANVRQYSICGMKLFKLSTSVCKTNETFVLRFNLEL